jgi:hypothetical protein
MQRVNVEPEIYLEFLIYTLSLSIGLRVIGRRWSSFDSTRFVETGDELAHELRSSITGNGFWNAEMTDPMSNQDIGILLGGEFGRGGNEDSFLRGLVNDD